MNERREVPPAEILAVVEEAWELALEARYVRPWPYDADPEAVFKKLDAIKRDLSDSVAPPDAPPL